MLRTLKHDPGVKHSAAKASGSPQRSIVGALALDHVLVGVALQDLEHNGAICAQDLGPRLYILGQPLVAAGAAELVRGRLVAACP